MPTIAPPLPLTSEQLGFVLRAAADLREKDRRRYLDALADQLADAPEHFQCGAGPNRRLHQAWFWA